MQKLNNILTVDPGEHTGWAFWSGDLCPAVGQINLSHSKNIIIQEDELVYLWKRFTNLLTELRPKLLYLEGVEFWEGSLKSVTAAKRQNLFKLSYLVGGYMQSAISAGIPTKLLPARVWKGQMSNQILKEKVYRINRQRYDSDHILNAVGIGLSRLGLFLNTRTMPNKVSKVKLCK